MSEFKLLRNLSGHHKRVIVWSVINQLSELGEKCLLSGDDSSLTNVWEEICVQAQSEESIYWDAYETTIDNYIESELETTPQIIKQAISYIEMIEVNEEEAMDYDQTTTVIAIRSKILEEAEEYNNENIDNYLGRIEEDNEKVVED